MGEVCRPHDTKLGRDVVGPAPNTLAFVDRKGVVDRFNVPPHFYTHPRLSPDGERVTFASNRDGTQSIYRQAADGRGVAERLTEAERPQWPESWSPDGRKLSIRASQSPELGLWTWSLDGGTGPEPFIDISSVNQLGSAFSPNGRWLAYASGQ